MRPATYPYYPMTNNIYYPNNYSNKFLLPPSKTVANNTDLSEYYLSVGKLDTAYNVNKSITLRELNQVTDAFHKLIETNTQEALNVVNDEDISFSALFKLRDHIRELALFEGLNLRNKIALILTDDILSRKMENHSIDFSSCDDIHAVHSALKWIVETGSVHDGLHSDHDAVIDIAAVFLIELFHEKTILSTVADMIFERNRSGRLNHDLVWAFFEARDPQSLVLIANRLKSGHKKDAEFARKLLGFVPGLHKSNHIDAEQQYSYIVNWLHDNSPFLHYTGESMQQRNSPIPYVIVLEAKYLCKTLYRDKNSVLESLTNKDYQLLDAFNKLDMNHKVLLSDFSFSLHQMNLSSWKMWLQYPIAEQIKIAKARTGGGL
ncbi:hypothetical protein [Geosporobacter ferrireducens]|nr:hypothetical protein [Geosporobacter ferrireducens]